MSSLSDVNQLFRLDGKTALITGGSRGIGLHTATAFLKAGASKVYITARKASGAEGIDQAVTKLNALPNIKGQAIGIPANVADTHEIQKLVEKIKSTEGKLDILVANAGASWGSSFEDAPDHSSVKILDLNVRGIFTLAQKYGLISHYRHKSLMGIRFAPLLSAAGTSSDPSRIIIVSSVAGETVPHVGQHGTIMYSTSKAAANVRNFSPLTLLELLY